jgi:hypothetical protein
MGASPRRILLWIRGLTWDVIDHIPAVDALRSAGTTITALEPLPITGSQPQAWQMMSGQTPGHSGFFDTWLPRRYVVQPASEPEAQMLHEMMTAAGHPAVRCELAAAEVPAYISTSAPSVECLIICTALSPDLAILEDAIEAARSWAGADGTFFLLSDHQSTAVTHYVNLNDAFHTLDILEVSTPHTLRWEGTLAYHAGHGQIWVNLAGREPLGMVTSGDEYNQTCQTLVHVLPGKLLDPHDGKPVIERVYRRDEIYQGEYLFRAPDLVVVLRPGYAPSPRSIAAGLDGTAVWPAPEGTRAVAGLHPQTVAGLAIATGEPFAPGHVVARSALTSIAPTILHTLHLPLPASMDGEVITDLFTPAFLQHYPVQRADPDSYLSSEDEMEILARLKSLGYLG